MSLKGLDERVGQQLTEEYGLNIKGMVFNLPAELLLLGFITLSAIAGFIVGYNWQRIFKKHK